MADVSVDLKELEQVVDLSTQAVVTHDEISKAFIGAAESNGKVLVVDGKFGGVRCTDASQTIVKSGNLRTPDGKTWYIEVVGGEVISISPVGAGEA